MFVKGKTNKPDTPERFEKFRGMDTKRFETKVFILQTEKGFEQLKDIEKMGTIIKKCDDSLQESLHETDGPDQLPKTFKNLRKC